MYNILRVRGSVGNHTKCDYIIFEIKIPKDSDWESKDTKECSMLRTVIRQDTQTITRQDLWF
jgi:hypothetical protein